MLQMKLFNKLFKLKYNPRYTLLPTSKTTQLNISPQSHIIVLTVLLLLIFVFPSAQDMIYIIKMSQSQSINQPVFEQECSNFEVKVKLLTDEIYTFDVQPNMPVSQLKRLIEEKVKVPRDKQRLVYGGKQLQDAQNISEYLKQSGVTIHLIAKAPTTSASEPQPQQPQQQQQQPQQQPQPQQQQQQPQPQGVPNFGNLFSGLLGPPGSNPNQNADLNQMFSNIGNLFRPPNPSSQDNNNQVVPGSFQIRMVTSPVITQQLTNNRPQTAAQSRATPPNIQAQGNNIPQMPQMASNPSTSFTVNSGPLVQLQNTLNRLNLPLQQVNPQGSARQQTILYLRRLQSQMLRFVPQLNRSIQLLQQGRIHHLPDLLHIFHSLNFANSGAVDIIQRYMQAHPQGEPAQLLGQTQGQGQGHGHHHHGHHGHHHHHGQQQQQQSLQQLQQQQNLMRMGINPNAANINNQQGVPPQLAQQIQQNITQSNQGNQPNQPGQSNPFGALSGLIGPNSGFNFANIFGQQPRQDTQQQPRQDTQQQPNTPNIQQSSTQQFKTNPNTVPPQSPTSPDPRQLKTNPNLPPQSPTLNSQPSRQLKTNPNVVPPQSTQVQSGIPQPQPLNASDLSQQLNNITIPVQGQSGQNNQGGGLNLMQMFNSMQQSGGIGELLSMSLGDMVDQDQMDQVYRHPFNVISGSEIIAMFTQKNFNFLNNKKTQFRQAFQQAVSAAGGRPQLIQRYTQDMLTLLMPQTEIKNKQQCQKRLQKIISTHLEKILSLFLDSAPEVNLQMEVVSAMKLLYCQSIEQLSKYTDNVQSVFENIKVNAVKLMDKFAPGLSGLFYSIVERDLIRIYREYDEEKQRKNQMTQEQAEDQAQLIKQIEQEAERDAEKMAHFEHSKYYPKPQ